MKENKRGITLIALIITIIVMLILVAVTINLAADGGLFAKSRKAARDTEEQSIYDQIVSAMELNEDGKIIPSETYESFKNKFNSYDINEETSSSKSKKVFTVKGARDTYTYTITENEIIIGKVKESEIPKKINWEDYMNGETVPTFTINPTIPDKDWANWPTTNYDKKGPNEIKFQIVSNSDSELVWDYEYVENEKRFSIFQGDNDTYSYYWEASDSPIGKSGWVFQTTYNSSPIEAETLPVFTNCTIELYDDVPDDKKAEYAETMNDFLDDIFILSEQQ